MPSTIPRTRLFVPSALDANITVAIDRDQAHYLKHVLRLTTDDEVRVFNGIDGEWIAQVTAITKTHGSLRPFSKSRPQYKEPDIWLVFAAVKKTPMDFIVEKATELGVEKLKPITTEFSSVARVNNMRLNAAAIEAAQQCERLSIPFVDPLQTLHDTINHWPTGRKLWIMDETGGGTPFLQTLQQDVQHHKSAIMVGPEGGFSEAEYKFLRSQDFVNFATLGRRILRTETACVTALAIWQMVAGDGNVPPRQ